MNKLILKTFFSILAGIIVLICGYTYDSKAENVEIMIPANIQYIPTENHTGELIIELSDLEQIYLNRDPDEKIYLSMCFSKFFTINKEGLSDMLTIESVSKAAETSETIIYEEIKREILPEEKEAGFLSLKIPVNLKTEYAESEAETEYPVLEKGFYSFHSGETFGIVLKSETEILCGFESDLSYKIEKLETDIQEEPEIIPSQEPEIIPSQEPEIIPSQEPEIIPSQEPEIVPSESPEEDSITPTTQPMPSGDITLQMNSETQKLKAGTTVLYEVKIKNEGEIIWDEVELESIFSCPLIVNQWSEHKKMQANANKAVLYGLQPGEEHICYLSAQLTEEQNGTVEHKVLLNAKNIESNQEISRDIAIKSEVEALKVDFQVTKTSDRQIAFAGDTIYYQICIRNTGERTLHSVITTEGFVNADIKAQFIPKEGIVLNNDRTKAKISEIKPGKAVTLSAFVIVPEGLEEEELLNQVSVITEETGSQVRTAQTGVTVQKIRKDEEVQDGGTMPINEADSPRTADDTDILLFLIMLFASALSSTGILWNMKEKRKIENDREV